MRCTAGLLGMAMLVPVSLAPAAEMKETRLTLTPHFSVRAIKDVAYYEGKNADPVKHKLDLYLPRDHKDFPVLLFVHGGAWQRGDKSSHLGVYRGLASFLARHGIGVVVANYRLSPAVKHPEHVKDVARAFAWTHQHIGKYGGDPDRIFVAGHSSGGHLVSLLSTDETHLKAHGLSPRNVRGVIAVSGVYYLGEDLFPKVFGTDPVEHQKAWPLKHVKGGLPPFLILYADKDLPGCGKEPAETFCRALRDKGNEVSSFEARESNHYKILFTMALAEEPVANKVLTFIQAHAFPRP